MKTIDIYPLKNRNVKISPAGELCQFNSELEAYINELWAPKQKAGWKSAWIPLMTNLSFDDADVKIKAKAITYAQTNGCLNSIIKKLPFAPPAGFVNNLSVGLIPMTNDGYIPISRRSLTASHCAGVWNIACGYMDTRFVEPTDIENIKHTKEGSLLFSPYHILEKRMEKHDFIGVEKELISREEHPNSLTIGQYHALEPGFSWAGRLSLSKKELQERLTSGNDTAGRKEHESVTFVHVDDVENLLMNQPSVLEYNPATYATNDPTKIILLDENIGGLVGGVFQKLTGRSISEQVIDKMRQGGIALNIKDTSKGAYYEFAERF